MCTKSNRNVVISLILLVRSGWLLRYCVGMCFASKYLQNIGYLVCFQLSKKLQLFWCVQINSIKLCYKNGMRLNKVLQMWNSTFGESDMSKTRV